jgi:predicted nucleic acid-binding protein
MLSTSADYVAAARVKATTRKNGSAVELPDCLIAAVAVRLDRALITGNTDDFLVLQRSGLNLTLANWREA